MQLADYYSRLVRDGRRGRPSMTEARADFERQNRQRVDTYVPYR
jgi:hypothetical protein